MVTTAIIGGGAAGISAAVSAARSGQSCVICEKMPRLGRKILASGNGRCNLLNEDLDESHYNASARGIVKSVFSRFGKEHIKAFFKELGLELYSDKGRIFPVTNQASSVLKMLEMELGRLSVPVELNFDVRHVSKRADGFILVSKKGMKIECQKLVIAGGGKAYPALGADGSSYILAKSFGHKIAEPVPSAVPLVVKDRLCHLLQGQRISARAGSVIDKRPGREAAGEVLFTKYGLSGTAILDISEEISIALNRNGKKDAAVSLDMIPFMTHDALEHELERRIRKGFSPQDLFAGILPNKFGIALEESANLRPPAAIATALKDKHFEVCGTRGWNEAEFTCGGVDMNEVNRQSLESKRAKGLYFAGEILDCQGSRGGYNLAWAWASGFTAGLTL